MVYSVIVTFKPEINTLNNVITSLVEQCDKIIIIKNSSDEINFDNKKILTMQLDKNYGIAYAQNRGIELALKDKADFVLFSDQDTIFPEKYVSQCIGTYKKYSSENKIGAVVPLFYNENKKQLSKIMITKTKSIVPEVGKVYFLAHAISSGSFCPKIALENVGNMNERMFIDYVDNEWCWRANKLGYKILCDTNIQIRHSMGDSFKKVLGHKFVVYSNFRNYFFFRNSYYLLFHSKLLSFKEFFNFLSYTKMKAVIFYLTKGISIKNIKMMLSAKMKGKFNCFTLDEELK